MRGVASILFAAAAVLSVSALLLAAPVAPRTSPKDAAGTEAVREAATPGVMESRAVRAVDPERFASPLAAELAALERIAPREPLTPRTQKKRQAVVLLPRPQSLAAGLIAVSRQELRLRHLVPTETALSCSDGAGGRWPCGMMALTQQRMLLRNRSIACEGTVRQWQGVLVTACRIGKLDIGEWLVRNGWARAEEGSPFAELMRQAEADRLGLFGGDPRQASARADHDVEP